jgi:tRNA 2-thiouridine synthesizing protein E
MQDLTPKYMATIVLNGQTYAVDDDGFLENPAIWNQEVAQDLATAEGIAGLSEDQWKVVNYLREYYLQFGMAPMIRKLCKETGFKLAQIYEMFPSGPAKGACKVAGLPKPTGCV